MIVLIDWRIERFAVFVFFPNIFSSFFEKIDRSARHKNIVVPHNLYTKIHRVCTLLDTVNIEPIHFDLVNRLWLRRVGENIISRAHALIFEHSRNVGIGESSLINHLVKDELIPILQVDSDARRWVIGIAEVESVSEKFCGGWNLGYFLKIKNSSF